MEIVDGCQLLEQLQHNVLYTLHVPWLKEQQQPNAHFGGQLAFLMEHHVLQRQHAPLTQLRSVAEMQELMEHASSLPQLEQPLQELADYNYALMQLQQQLQVYQLILDA